MYKFYNHIFIFLFFFIGIGKINAQFNFKTGYGYNVFRPNYINQYIDNRSKDLNPATGLAMKNVTFIDAVDMGFRYQGNGGNIEAGYVRKWVDRLGYLGPTASKEKFRLSGNSFYVGLGIAGEKMGLGAQGSYDTYTINVRSAGAKKSTTIFNGHTWTMEYYISYEHNLSNQMAIQWRPFVSIPFSKIDVASIAPSNGAVQNDNFKMWGIKMIIYHGAQ
jgi:hypothetical protein